MPRAVVHGHGVGMRDEYRAYGVGLHACADSHPHGVGMQSCTYFAVQTTVNYCPSIAASRIASWHPSSSAWVPQDFFGYTFPSIPVLFPRSSDCGSTKRSSVVATVAYHLDYRTLLVMLPRIRRWQEAAAKFVISLLHWQHCTLAMLATTIVAQQLQSTTPSTSGGTSEPATVRRMHVRQPSTFASPRVPVLGMAIADGATVRAWPAAHRSSQPLRVMRRCVLDVLCTITCWKHAGRDMRGPVAGACTPGLTGRGVAGGRKLAEQAGAGM